MTNTIIIFRGARIIMNLHMYNYTGMSLTTSVITEVSLWWFVKDVVYCGCSFCDLLIVKHVISINNQCDLLLWKLFCGSLTVTSTCSSYTYMKLRPLQINSLFPVLDSSIFACGRAGGRFISIIHYKIGSFSSHYVPGTTIKSCIKACLSLFLPFEIAKIAQT